MPIANFEKKTRNALVELILAKSFKEELVVNTYKYLFYNGVLVVFMFNYERCYINIINIILMSWKENSNTAWKCAICTEHNDNYTVKSGQWVNRITLNSIYTAVR